MKKILITGATGYVGRKLLKELEKEDYALRCMVRSPKKLKKHVRHTTEIVSADAQDKNSLKMALKGIDVAYYFIHSMGEKADFRELDRKAAINFAEAASEQGVKRIIYLGGLSESREDLSEHLKSRTEVGELLLKHAKGVQILEFRASIVIGSGSLSFEMVRALCERLPMMVTPKWVFAKAQPIAIQDLLIYLFKAIEISLEGNQIFEIGGKDQVSYAEIMQEYNRQRGLKRLMIPIPILTPYLSSLWLGFVTPLYSRVGRKLIESACYDTVVNDHSAESVFGIHPVGIVDAIKVALHKEDIEYGITRWLDEYQTDELRQGWGGVLVDGRIFDTRFVDTSLTPEEAFASIEAIGGSNGWYYGDWMWQIRGAFDRVLGGVGMRRKRPHPHHLKEGDILDFWRVEVLEPNRRLRLHAEMKVPGRAWLEFLVEPSHHKTRIRQTAIYDPLGVMGLLYWYLLYPVHRFVFAGMLRGVVHRANHQHINDLTFERKSPIAVSAENLFEWHTRPGAFERLTPPWEKVELIEKTGGIEEGSKVTLRFPMGLKWVSRHYDLIENRQFCDEQIKGPFVKWLHVHRMLPKTERTSVLEDNIVYRLPLGSIGRALGKKTMQRKLERLFRYRHEVTAQDLKQWHTMERAPMKILLVGSSGLVGSALRPFLLSGGHRVIQLVRHESQLSDDSCLWNPDEGTVNPSDLEGFDAVINLAGENIAKRWSEKVKQRILESRVKSTRLLADTLAHLENPPKVWINASAVGFYGDRGDDLVNEESSLGKGFLAGVCEKWEAATDAAQKAGIRVVHARFGIVITPKGGVLGRVLPIFKMGLGGMIGNGGQYMSWVSIDDLVGILAHLLTTDSLQGAVNVTTPYPISNYDFTKTLGKVLGRPTVLPLPAIAAKLVFGSEMAEEMLLSSTRVQPKKLIDSGYVFRYPKLENALRHLLGK